MIRIVTFCALTFWATAPIFAESEGSQELSPPPTGEVLSTSGALSSTRNAFELLTGASMVNPTTFSLTNDGFEIPYSENFEGFLSFRLTLAKAVARLQEVNIFAQVSAGYSFKEQKLPVRPLSRGPETSDTIRLRWVPLTASVRAVGPVPGVRFLKPALTLGAGTQLLHQTGDLRGVEGVFLIPFYFATPSLSLFESESADDWFGGVTFGTTFFNSASGPSRVLRGMSFDLSMTILL